MVKRKEKNLTQAELAEKLGISNKTISKWECGKAPPDYTLVEEVCSILSITTSELFSGEDNHQTDEKQMIDMLERIQKLENQKKTIFGILLMILGMSCFYISQLFGGSSFKDFLSGFLVGLSSVEMLVGVFISISSISKQ